MTPSPILIRVSENPGEVAWPLVTTARERTRELALRLFISIHGAYLSSTRDRHHGPTTPMAATVQTCLHEMKRNFGIACLLLLVVAAVYAGMWLYGRKTARPGSSEGGDTFGWGSGTPGNRLFVAQRWQGPLSERSGGGESPPSQDPLI